MSSEQNPPKPKRLANYFLHGWLTPWQKQFTPDQIVINCCLFKNER